MGSATYPWGDPDLQGPYSNLSEDGTPLERPDQFKGRQLQDVKGEELLKIRQGIQDNTVRSFAGPLHAQPRDHDPRERGPEASRDGSAAPRAVHTGADHRPHRGRCLGSRVDRASPGQAPAVLRCDVRREPQDARPARSARDGSGHAASRERRGRRRDPQVTLAHLLALTDASAEAAASVNVLRG